MTPPDETTLRTADGVDISAVHVRGAVDDLCFVLVHGLTGNWREDRVRKVVDRLIAFGSVVAIDMRGHGRSSGVSTVGKDEVLDVAAAVAWARSLGYPRVVAIGFSMGGAVVLREAGLAEAGRLVDHGLVAEPGTGRVDAVVSVSAPAFWYYRGTRVMRLVHRLVGSRSGRMVMRLSGTRISGDGWDEPPPTPPHEAAALLGSVPLLVVHGDVDRYFPVEHPQSIVRTARAAGVPADLWLIRGFGHAESAISTHDLDRIGAWARQAVTGRGTDRGMGPLSPRLGGTWPASG